MIPTEMKNTDIHQEGHFPFEGGEQYHPDHWRKKGVLIRKDIEHYFGVRLEMYRKYKPFVACIQEGLSAGTYLLANYNFIFRPNDQQEFDPTYDRYLVFQYVGPKESEPTSLPPEPFLIRQKFQKRLKKMLEGQA